MRSQRGAITLITLGTVIFILAFLLSSYVIISNRLQAQAEIKKETGEIYGADVENVDEIYNNYFADSNAIIPISTADDLLKVGTNSQIYYNNKIYVCNSNGDYKLINNISFEVADYLSKYPEAFENETTWINIEDKIANGSFTGTFDYNGNTITEIDTQGNEIEHPIINYIEYIESTGTQYIDTGIIPNQDTRLEMVAEVIDVSNAADGIGFIPYGTAISHETNAFECYIWAGQYEFNYDGQFGLIGTAQIGDKISISHNKNVVNIVVGTNQYSHNFNYYTFTSPSTMTLFATNREPMIRGKARIYSCQIFDNGVLVRDFKPALDDSNVPCLYDKITKEYFYNSGTGTFNYQ